MLRSVSDLIALHFRLEGVGVNIEGDLVPLPCPNSEGVPRFYVAQHTDDGAFSGFVRHDVPEVIRRELLRLPPAEALHRHDLVKRVLAPHGACASLHYGKSYVCPDSLTPGDYQGVVLLDQSHRDLIQDYDARIDPARRAVFAAVVDGRIVSTCESSRENDTAAEAWVRTLPEYRQRGLGRRVTAAWAAHLLAQGKVAFYSHRMDNLASEGIARSLGLKQFITDAAYA